jgi:hypothetical protein
MLTTRYAVDFAYTLQELDALRNIKHEDVPHGI